jgi:hypothetical protein
MNYFQEREGEEEERKIERETERKKERKNERSSCGFFAITEILKEMAKILGKR